MTIPICDNILYYTTIVYNSKHIYFNNFKKIYIYSKLLGVDYQVQNKNVGEVVFMKKDETTKQKSVTQETIQKKKSYKVVKFLGDPKLRYSVLAVCILVIAFLVQYFVNKPNLGAYLSSDMDLSGNVYVLGVDTESEQYKITKIKANGAMDFKINLEKSDKDFAYSYSNLEADSKGNFYFVKQKRDLNTVVSDKTLYPIKSETVIMYDTNGNYVKDVLNLDFTKYANPPTSNYVKKIQLSNQLITIIGGKDNSYEVMAANPMEDETPQKVRSFEINPEIEMNEKSLSWVNDICILSTGRVFYSTNNGELWGMDNQGVFVNYSNAVSNSQFLISNMNVDPNNDIYFSDAVTGNYYKLDTKSVVSRQIYNLDSYLDLGQTIKGSDIRKIKVLDTNDFYAPSKAFDKPFYVRFGANNSTIMDIRGNFMPWGLITMFVVCVICLALYFLVRYISTTELKRIPLAVRILSMFLPFYLVSMGILVYVNTTDALTEYVSVLKMQQERGAKTVVDNIDGSAFSRLDHVSGFMSKDYVDLQKAIMNSYKEINLKIGDRSDYLVAYIEHYNKLFATINTKYASDSDSYSELKYTNPDMVPSHYALVDTLLEKDECNALYDIWDKFSSKTNATDSLEMTFRDVYGDMTGSFVAIKDTNGRVVGFVGNFLDSDIHHSKEFWRIFKHALAVVLIISILVFAYICLVIRWCLRPLKVIESAINTMGKGEWDIKIKVKSKDELADIAEAFNLMAEKISRYTANLIRLNKEYIRYVPTEIFRLMNKEKITQVNLHDHNIVDMNVVYVSFNLSCKNSFDFKDEDELFEALNKTYEEMFKVIEKNNGVVQSFDGLDAVIMFPKSAVDAFNASIQFKEVDINKTVKEHMRVTLGRGSVLVGVSGNKDRRGVVVVSDEIMQLFSIDSDINKIGINHVATKSIIDNLGGEGAYNYRFIGRVGNITGEGSTDIFEIIDSSNKYKKDLYDSTKEMFEKAVSCYLLSDFEEARRIFTDVLRVNENDKVAVYYLMKCEEQLGRLGSGSGTKSGFTGYLV